MSTAATPATAATSATTPATASETAPSVENSEKHRILLCTSSYYIIFVFGQKCHFLSLQ